MQRRVSPQVNRRLQFRNCSSWLAENLREMSSTVMVEMMEWRIWVWVCIYGEDWEIERFNNFRGERKGVGVEIHCRKFKDWLLPIG